MIDGRRIWLVSGSVPFARICRDEWRDRIHAAKVAGVNAIETAVIWSRHEPRPGKFDFKGENDIRAFVELVAEAGLYCILRVGPYIGGAWDMGGLPPWLTELKDIQLRTSSNSFLEACSRFITTLAEQVRDLQVTSSGKGGPIVLVQSESQWTCGDEELALEYLGELNRYLREAGLTVPVVNANNLWQSHEGEIDVWAGTDEMLATMRQLAVVRPGQPRLVIDFGVQSVRTWGQADDPMMNAWQLQRKLAEALAGGGQVNLNPFAAGIYPGFLGGRVAGGQTGFVCPASDPNACVDEAGVPTSLFNPARRVLHFASKFGRVFANLDPEFRPVTIDPSPRSEGGQAKRKERPVSTGGLSVVFAKGVQGSIAFVFDDDSVAHAERAPIRQTNLLMPDGSSMPVTLGQQSVGWSIFGVNATPRSVIDYCNINAFAVVGQVFIAFGPGEAPAKLSVNGSPIEVAVPGGAAPLVIEHEGLTIVIVNEEHIDSTFVTDTAVFVGVSGVTAAGEPIPQAEGGSFVRIDAAGKLKKISADAPKAHAPEKVTLGTWSVAPAIEYQDGTSPRYASIKGPADLTALGCPFGYGWYRLSLTGMSAGKVHLAFPEAADRLHLFLDGEFVGLVGNGPGAASEAVLNIKKTSEKLVLLAENLGRFSGGLHLGERKGLFGPIWEHQPLKVGKPKLVRGQPIDLLGYRTPLWEVRDGDSTLPERVTWSIPHHKKASVIVWFHQFPGRALLILNDQPIAVVDRSGPSSILLSPDQLGKGTATIQIAPFGEHATEHSGPLTLEEVSGAITFSEASEPFAPKAEFAFAKWERPGNTMFTPVAKGSNSKSLGPSWWKTTFKVGTSRTPLFVDLSGMFKGQVYLNGHHVSRYFVATPDGKTLPPQDRYLLPDPLLHHGRENELVLFDEHGGNPAKVRIAYHDSPRAVLRA
jgi:hypothetical protein